MANITPVPEKTLIDPSDPSLTWSVYPERASLIRRILGALPLIGSMYPTPTSTGLRTLALEDSASGVLLATTHPNPGKRTAAHRAWAGARHSRAPGNTMQIMHEMGERGVDPDQKLEDTFRGYGHQSPANAAWVDVHFNNTPMHVPLFLFNFFATNGGQEKSTRYQQSFGKSPLHPLGNYLPSDPAIQTTANGLEEWYQSLGRRALSVFSNSRSAVRTAFVEYYKPETEKETASLESRVLDSVRGHLLLGQSTGFMIGTDAREWGKLIAALGASEVPFYRRLGSLLETTLSPDARVERALQVKGEAPSLVRHTQPDRIAAENLDAVAASLRSNDILPASVGKNYAPELVRQCAWLIPDQISAAQRMAAQYIMSLQPEIGALSAMALVHSMPAELQRTLGKAIYQGHDRNHELPVQARTTGMSVVFESSLGELRDLNRHRALGRYIQLPNPLQGGAMGSEQAMQLINRGYTLPLYLTHVPGMEGARKVVQGGLQVYYDDLKEFMLSVVGTLGRDANYAFVLNLLPLAHQVDLVTHWDPKQASYFPDLRVRDGGHINYRALAYDAANAIADSEPLLDAVRIPVRPDPGDRKQFFSRS